MSRLDTDSIIARIDLRTWAERYTTLDKSPKAKERHGPCPVCGGSDRFYVQADHCGCRQCGWGGDVFDLVMRTEHVEFLEAYKMVTGEALPERTPVKPVAQVKQPTAGDEQKRAYFLAAAPGFVERAHQALMAGGAGADYLALRGLSPELWETYRLGYTDAPAGVSPQFCKPSIVIPWIVKGQIEGVRYRLLHPVQTVNAKGESKAEKGRSFEGSRFAGFLYGGHALPEFVTRGWAGDNDVLQFRTLVLCEGELNAVSIAQVSEAARIDVLSVGSQSQTLPDGVIRVAKRYRTVLIWMDEQKFAEARLKDLGCGFSYWSTGKDDIKIDANDWLKRDALRGLLMALTKRATPEALRHTVEWDWEDAA